VACEGPHERRRLTAPRARLEPVHEPIALTAGAARVEVVPEVGGAVAGFRVAGMDVLRPATAVALERGDVLALASYPLVPYSNRIAHARLRLGEDVRPLARNFGDHPHAIHGVGWQRAWTVSHADRRALSLELAHRPVADDALAWPCAFVARQSFALAGDGDAVALTASIGITSEDDLPFPFGLGFHPFFARRPGMRLAFRAAGVWRTDATTLPTERTDVPPEWDFATVREIGDVAIDNAFTGWDGLAVVDWPRERLRARVDADRSMSHLVVYVPRSGDSVAIEPVTHMPDAFNRAAAGESGTGTRLLRPGETFSCTMRITATVQSR
jgi:aldose 1-epimerase